jgi:Mg2+/Co2+ transporter CorB
MKELILGLIEDLVSDFTYYNRKECEQLSADDLENAILSGEVTIKEIADEFEKQLREEFSEAL